MESDRERNLALHAFCRRLLIPNSARRRNAKVLGRRRTHCCRQNCRCTKSDQEVSAPHTVCSDYCGKIGAILPIDR